MKLIIVKSQSAEHIEIVDVLRIENSACCTVVSYPCKVTITKVFRYIQNK